MQKLFWASFGVLLVGMISGCTLLNRPLEETLLLSQQVKAFEPKLGIAPVKRLHLLSVLFALSLLVWGFTFPDIWGSVSRRPQSMTLTGVMSSLILVSIFGFYVRSVLKNNKRGYYHKSAFKISIIFLVLSGTAIISSIFSLTCRIQPIILGCPDDLWLFIASLPWALIIIPFVEGEVVKHLYQSETIFQHSIVLLGVFINAHIIYWLVRRFSKKSLNRL